MTWIKTIPEDEATGSLKRAYQRVKGSGGPVDNILVAHSLRPHTLVGHMHLYKSVLHHTGNKIPAWYLETIGVYVSIVNGCHYCIEHHAEGLRKLIDDENMYNQLFEALQSGHLGTYFDPKQLAGLQYARQLTISPQAIEEDQIEHLRQTGFSDGEILELNQVTCYFNYANRMVLGLGISTEGDVLGLSPQGDDDDWGHQ